MCKGCPNKVDRADSYSPVCNAERRRLKALRDWFAQYDCEADLEARALRVELYADLVARGLGIFEDRRRAT